VIDLCGRPWELPALAHRRLRACAGSSTARGPVEARDKATSDVAFRFAYQRRAGTQVTPASVHMPTPGLLDPAAQLPSLHVPLSTPRRCSSGRRRMTRGHRGSRVPRMRKGAAACERRNQQSNAVQEMEQGAVSLLPGPPGSALRERDSKPLQGASVKSRGLERCRKRQGNPCQVCTTELSESEPSRTRRKVEG